MQRKHLSKIFGIVIGCIGIILSASPFFIYGFGNVGGLSFLIWMCSPYLVYILITIKFRWIFGIFLAGIFMIAIDSLAHYYVYFKNIEGWKLWFFPITLYILQLIGFLIGWLIERNKVALLSKSN